MRAASHLVLPLVAVLAGCWGENAYILEGTVLEVNPPTQVIVDHEAVPGLMGPMIMPFEVPTPEQAAALKRGDRIVARLMVEDHGAVLEKIRVTGHQTLPEPEQEGPGPLKPGDVLPTTELPVTGGERWTVGAGQGVPTVLTFLYTTCPLPNFCPMVVSRLQGLQAKLTAGEARALAVTIDPGTDTLEVLAAYAENSGADEAIWRFGRVEGTSLASLALAASLPLSPDGEDITHGLRLLVLDAEGRLVERYDDNCWDLDRVLSQLRTGTPKAPAGSDGTASCHR